MLPIQHGALPNLSNLAPQEKVFSEGKHNWKQVVRVATGAVEGALCAVLALHIDFSCWSCPVCFQCNCHGRYDTQDCAYPANVCSSVRYLEPVWCTTYARTETIEFTGLGAFQQQVTRAANPKSSRHPSLPSQIQASSRLSADSEAKI